VRFGDGPIRFSSDVLHRKAAAVEARHAVVELGTDLLAEEEFVSMLKG